jgi:hypothetical protein
MVAIGTVLGLIFLVLQIIETIQKIMKQSSIARTDGLWTTVCHMPSLQITLGRGFLERNRPVYRYG